MSQQLLRKSTAVKDYAKCIKLDAVLGQSESDFLRKHGILQTLSKERNRFRSAGLDATTETRLLVLPSRT